jgi:putative molybdopterin biosynthesis protein
VRHRGHPSAGPASGEYNRPLLTAELALVQGYGRMQGIVHRRGDVRFEGRTPGEAIAAASQAADCVMVNRNAGSGTRILVDRLLGGLRPAGTASRRNRTMRWRRP